METENAAVNEALRLSPWGAKMASLHEQPQQKCGAGVRPETENKGAETAGPEDAEQRQGAAEESQVRQQAPNRG